MGTSHSPSKMQAFGVIRDLTYDAASSSANAGAVLPGSAVAVQPTGLQVYASGDQPAADTVTITAQRGGYPAPDGAAYVYQHTDGTGSRGWIRPTAIMSFEAVTFTTSADGLQKPHALALANGSILIACDAPSGSDNAINIRKRGSSGTFSDIGDIHSEEQNSNADLLCPCLVLLPSLDNDTAGRVLCLYVTQDVDRDRCGIAMYYSDDSGTTWADGGSVGDALHNPTIYAPRKLRAAYKNGQILALLHMLDINTVTTYSDRIVQYASSDLGATFRKVTTIGGSATENGSFPEVVSSGGVFVCVWADSTKDLKAIRIADAFENLENSRASTLTDGATGHGAANNTAAGNTECSIALLATDGGELYVYWRSLNDTYDSRLVLVSYDHGATWVQPGDSGSNVTGEETSKWFDSFDAANGPIDYTIVWQRGRGIGFCNCDGGIRTNSLYAFYLGAYSTVTLPRASVTRQAPYTGWEKMWLPFQLPDASGAWWTHTTSGTGTAAMANGAVQITSAAGANHSYYTYNGPSGTIAEGLIDIQQVTMISGVYEAIFTIDSGAAKYDVSVRISSTTITISDVNGSWTDNTTTFDPTTGIKFLIVMRQARVRVWAIGGVHGADQEWELVGTTGTLTSAAGAVANHKIVWGGQAGVACDAYVMMHGYNHDEYTGVIKDLSQFTNPDDLAPRPFSLSPVYIVNDVEISAQGGPAIKGDSWTIDTDATHPIANLDPLTVPTPKLGWRSIAATADMTLVFDLGSTAEDYDVGNDSVFFWFDRVNFADCKIEYRQGGSWATLTTVDFSNLITYTRRGSAIIPSASGDDRYFHRNELAGAQFNNATDVRTILSNTEGRLEATAATHKVATIVLSDHDSGDAASGFGDVWETSALVVAHLAGSRDWESIRLTLRTTAGASPASAVGYHSIGNFAFGHLAPLGTDPAVGTSRTTGPNVELGTLPDGQRSTRQIGDPSFALEVPFTDARSALGDSGVDATSDYLLASSAANSEPVAGWEDTCMLVAGLIDEHSDGRAILYVPHFDAGSTGDQVQTYIGGRGAFMTRLLGAWTYNTVNRGREHSAEVHRGGTLLLERER